MDDRLFLVVPNVSVIYCSQWGYILGRMIAESELIAQEEIAIWSETEIAAERLVTE